MASVGEDAPSAVAASYARVGLYPLGTFPSQRKKGGYIGGAQHEGATGKEGMKAGIRMKNE